MTDREFELVLKQWGGQLLSYALKLKRGRMEDAQDLLSAATLRLWKNRERVNAFDAVKYASTIIRNLDRDQSRDSKRKVQAELVDERGLEVIPDASPSVLARVTADESLERARALAKDPFIFATITGEMTQPEVANALGIPLLTVRSRAHRLRTRLRESGIWPDMEAEPALPIKGLIPRSDYLAMLSTNTRRELARKVPA